MPEPGADASLFPTSERKIPRAAAVLQVAHKAPAFCPPARRGKGRIPEVCNPFRNAAGGQKDKPDGALIFGQSLRLLEAIEALYPLLAIIHVYLDNARYHHAKLVQAWLAQPGRGIRLHFIPAYCPHLTPIERLWGVMHKHVTHNKCYATSREFAGEVLTFLREKVPQNWADLCNSVTDNFRVINPKDFRVLA